jgi:hypothetical protein
MAVSDIKSIVFARFPMNSGSRRFEFGLVASRKASIPIKIASSEGYTLVTEKGSAPVYPWNDLTDMDCFSGWQTSFQVFMVDAKLKIPCSCRIFYRTVGWLDQKSFDSGLGIP